jgi:hypothetical protein
VQAVRRELVRFDVVPDLAGCGALGQQPGDEPAQVLGGLDDVLARCSRAARSLLCRRRVARGVGDKDCVQSLGRRAGLLTGRREQHEVAVDLSLVPCAEECLDVGEVLVQRRTADAGVLRDLRHRDGSQSCSAMSAAAASSAASRTAPRWASIESCQSFGTAGLYMLPRP